MTVRISAYRPAVDSFGPPPSFTIRTDRTFVDVEIATDPLLLGGALASRRTPANFHSSRADGALPVGPDGRAEYALPERAWAALTRYQFLYYRALAYDGSPQARERVEASIADAEVVRAPSVQVPPGGTLPPPRRRLSASLGWLRVEGNRLVDEAGGTVVLRGVNRSGLEDTERFTLDPDGVVQPTSRKAAGITQREIREIVRTLGANVVRLPINQEWALTRSDYRVGIDSIVHWAAAEGAYTLLALRRLDVWRDFGVSDSGIEGVAPLPEAASVDLWRLLARRYGNEPAVLYDLYSEPHEPLPSDAAFALDEPPVDRPGWVELWHEWVRRLAEAILRQNGRALIFVSGWDFGRDLRALPVRLPGGRALPNAISSAQVFYDDTPGRSTVDASAVAARLAFPADPDALRERGPVFVGAWGGDDVEWGTEVESYLRSRHRERAGVWQGLAGWAAWSWADPPLLVERRLEERTEGGRTLRWRPFVREDGHNRPTPFGALVRDALSRPPEA